MKTKLKSLLLLVLINSLYLSPCFSQDISEMLTPLKPFLNKTWNGEFLLPDGTIESTIVRTYEALPGGKIIKLTKVNEGKGSMGEGFFYWDDILKKIAFFSIESNGVFCTGTVSVIDNVITIEGKMTWPSQNNPQAEQSYDFKNTFEFTSGGNMIDKWYMNAFGPWRDGHVIEFRPQEEQK